jgi:phage baseplate assembly protein W
VVQQVLITEPGERAKRPMFGCGRKRLLFEPNAGVCFWRPSSSSLCSARVVALAFGAAPQLGNVSLWEPRIRRPALDLESAILDPDCDVTVNVAHIGRLRSHYLSNSGWMRSNLGLDHDLSNDPISCPEGNQNATKHEPVLGAEDLGQLVGRIQTRYPGPGLDFYEGQSIRGWSWPRTSRDKSAYRRFNISGSKRPAERAIEIAQCPCRPCGGARSRNSESRGKRRKLIGRLRCKPRKAPKLLECPFAEHSVSAFLESSGRQCSGKLLGQRRNCQGDPPAPSPPQKSLRPFSPAGRYLSLSHGRMCAQRNGVDAGHFRGMGAVC